jgi:hypothetical protein
MQEATEPSILMVRPGRRRAGGDELLGGVWRHGLTVAVEEAMYCWAASDGRVLTVAVEEAMYCWAASDGAAWTSTCSEATCWWEETDGAVQGRASYGRRGNTIVWSFLVWSFLFCISCLEMDGCVIVGI